MGRPQFGCELDALVGVPRRHPDVRQDHVRSGLVDGGARLIQVRAGRHELDVVDVFERTRDSLACEVAVLSEYDANRRQATLTLAVAHTPPPVWVPAASGRG